jgi:hypothetical protein
MPGYAALLLSGVFLALAALGCLRLSMRAEADASVETPQPNVNAALSLLSKKTAENPTKAMIAGIAAGAAYGLLDAFEKKK